MWSHFFLEKKLICKNYGLKHDYASDPQMYDKFLEAAKQKDYTYSYLK